MECTIIGIAGGTGSGKSTFTDQLKDRFGKGITVLYHDNYYRKHDEIPLEERKNINYDHPDALETDLLVEHLKALKNGKTVHCPVYDFAQHNRSFEVIEVNPSPVIIIEGILVFQDKRLRDLCDIKLYVDADADERILRRTLRDVKERGRDLNGIIKQYLSTVKPMHYLYVEPTKKFADLVINNARDAVAVDIVATKIKKLLDAENEKE